MSDLTPKQLRVLKALYPRRRCGDAALVLDLHRREGREAGGVMTEVQELLDFLTCPLADKNFKPVPVSEIRCRYDACVWGGGVAGMGVCHRGDPRDADCQGFRQECPGCQGDGGWDGTEATCRTCGGMGWVKTEVIHNEPHAP